MLKFWGGGSRGTLTPCGPWRFSTMCYSRAPPTTRSSSGRSRTPSASTATRTRPTAPPTMSPFTKNKTKYSLHGPIKFSLLLILKQVKPLLQSNSAQGENFIENLKNWTNSASDCKIWLCFVGTRFSIKFCPYSKDHCTEYFLQKF